MILLQWATMNIGEHIKGAGQEFFICRRFFFFQQLVDPPFLPNAVCFIRMLCIRKIRKKHKQA